MSSFHEFAKLSNLRLNLDKTALIPLWESSRPSVRRWLRDDFPNWAKLEISWWDASLALIVLAWVGARPCQNVEFVCQHREACTLVAMFTRLSVVRYLAFCSNLSTLPLETFEAEAWALPRMAPGPGNWIRPIDLCHLQSDFGLPLAIASFSHMAVAAKRRVTEYEPQLRWQEQHELAQASSRTCWIGVHCLERLVPE